VAGAERAAPPLYIVIRVPKSGSTSLANMLRAALPDARVFSMPTDPAAHAHMPALERLRLARNRARALWRNYRALSLDAAWRKIAAEARAGDIVTGHLRHGDARLPGHALRHITLVRDPLARLLSQYNYSREGFARRGALRRWYHQGQVQAAARHDFSGYLAWLEDHRDAYADQAARFVYGDATVNDPIAFLRAHYFHIGRVENLDAFRAGLAARLGTSVPARHDNTSARRDATALAAADRPRFERLCARDLALYEAVRALEREGP
jgi:hypothetical protein